MSNITKPIILNETGVAIKEAIQGLQPDSACVVTINGASISLKQWITNCEAGVYDSTYLGVKATITNLIDKKSFRVRLIGINHDTLASDLTTKAKTTWQFYDMPMKQVPLGLPFDFNAVGDGAATALAASALQDYLDGNDPYLYPSNKHGYHSAVNLLACLDVIMSSLPLELQRAIKTVDKDCFVPFICYTDDYSDIEPFSTATYVKYEGADGLTYTKMQCKLFHLSACEVGIIHNPNDASDPFPLRQELMEWDDDEGDYVGTGEYVPLEGTKYEYFNETYAYTSEANDDRRRPCKFNGEDWYYWLRTPYLEISFYWAYVNYYGGVSNINTLRYGGVAPAFCI